MAEASALAFGRYLRQLRERRSLSLADVCDLSKSSPEPIDKGTISRLERGQQTPSIFRLGPFCRIYEIPPDALIERMELDREVDRVGAPDTGGRTFDDLYHAGGDAVVRGNRKWEAYACYRDALPLAPPDKRIPAWINLVTMIRSLGKYALALHELRELSCSEALDAGQDALVQEILSNCCRCLGDMKQAETYAETAIERARQLGDSRILAHALRTRGCAAIDQEQWPVAHDYLLRALASYRDGVGSDSRLVPSPAFEAQTFLLLAECALRDRNMSRARRLTLAAQRMGQDHELPQCLAYCELLLGWVDEAAGRVDRALARWRRATALAGQLNDTRIAFAAEVEILRQAMGAGDAARARAAKRRLARLVPWVPRHIPAYRLYMQLTQHGSAQPLAALKGDAHEMQQDTFGVDDRAGRGGVADIDERRDDRRRPDERSGHRRVAVDGRSLRSAAVHDEQS
jgi:transcriptional regulator with XRE-family HTH domain